MCDQTFGSVNIVLPENDCQQLNQLRVIQTSTLKPSFHLDIFLPFVARFDFSYQQKATTSNAMLKWKHPQKNQNKQQKAITSNNRHSPVLVFEKQEEATKGSKRQ